MIINTMSNIPLVKTIADPKEFNRVTKNTYKSYKV